MKPIPALTFEPPAEIAAPQRPAWARLARSIVPSSLRARLVIIVVAVDCLAAVLTGSVIMWKAREATKLEVASAMQLAQTLVSDTIRLMQDAPAPILLQSIDLHFQSVRHVKIAVVDAAGRPVEADVSQDQTQLNADVPPNWFVYLSAPPIERKTFPIVVHHADIGAVTITSVPGDEIAEAWTYAHALLVTAAGLNVAVLAALFLAFGRILAPLTALASGLRNLETRNYSIRLPQPSLAELASITSHFNSTAEALSAAHDANRELHRKLLTAQDDERRRTALELHDEAGPCLFALEANATSIVSLAKASGDLSRIHERARDVVTLVERVQSINRRVLDRLRPMALGQIPLRDSLIRILVDFEAAGTGPAIHHDIGAIRDSYGKLADLTIYRCVQEGLFNAIRHARATRIGLVVDETTHEAADRLRIVVTDDGQGLPPSAQGGLGLSGMRERVEALAGQFDITSSAAGTTLAILIPLDTVADPIGDDHGKTRRS